MKCEVPLTPEQCLFAAKHHDLVYKFLRRKQLSVDEFYDIVIFALFDRTYIKAIFLCNYRLEINGLCCT